MTYNALMQSKTHSYNTRLYTCNTKNNPVDTDSFKYKRILTSSICHYSDIYEQKNKYQTRVHNAFSVKKN